MTDAFAALADDYESWYATPLGAWVIAEEERVLLEALEGAGTDVLEVGAGTGWWARRLAADGRRVTALEPSAAMRGAGEARTGDGVTWVAGTAESLPFPDGTFDAVLVMTVLEFVADPAAALAEAWRVVRADGLLVVGHLHPASEWAHAYRALGEQGVAPWHAARLLEPDAVVRHVGREPERRYACVHLGPDAEPPFGPADAAARADGSVPAVSILRWRKAS